MTQIFEHPVFVLLAIFLIGMVGEAWISAFKGKAFNGSDKDND